MVAGAGKTRKGHARPLGPLLEDFGKALGLTLEGTGLVEDRIARGLPGLSDSGSLWARCQKGGGEHQSIRTASAMEQRDQC